MANRTDTVFASLKREAQRAINDGDTEKAWELVDEMERRNRFWSQWKVSRIAKIVSIKEQLLR